MEAMCRLEPKRDDYSIRRSSIFCTWMCLPDSKFLTFAISIFVFIYHPSIFSCPKHPILLKLGVWFLPQCAQNTHKLLNFDENPLIAVLKYGKNTQKAGTYTYNMSM